MISRIRDTGIELAIDEGSAGSLPILVSWGRNGLPPLSVDATPGQSVSGGPLRAFDVSRPAEAKLTGLLEAGSPGFVPGHLLWLERDLISGCPGPF